MLLVLKGWPLPRFMFPTMGWQEDISQVKCGWFMKLCNMPPFNAMGRCNAIVYNFEMWVLQLQSSSWCVGWSWHTIPQCHRLPSFPTSLPSYQVLANSLYINSHLNSKENIQLCIIGSGLYSMHICVIFFVTKPS